MQRPPVDYVAALDGTLDRVRIGVITNQSLVEASSDQMMAVFDDAVGEVSNHLGVEVTDFEVPLYEALHDGTFLALQAEASRMASQPTTRPLAWTHGRPTFA